MTHDELRQAATSSLEDRVRDAIKGVLEQVMEEEMTAQLQAKHRERNGHYGRALTTTAGHIEQIRVPRAREMPFLTEVFERYRRMTGSLEEAVLEMYLQGVSTRKVEEITGKLSGIRISKDAVSRIAGRFDDVFAEWRGRQLDQERSYPYLYLDATYLKARWAGAVRDVALLVAVGVSDEGYREVLAVEALTYTAFPSSHHRLIRTTNGLERVFREVKRRTRVVGVFPNEQSAETLATAVLLRVSEDWSERKYLDMAPLHALLHQPTRFAT